MASRDLTSAFIERRSAANLRRRTGDNVGGSRMKPFGENSNTSSYYVLVVLLVHVLYDNTMILIVPCSFMFNSLLILINMFYFSMTDLLTGISKGGLDSDIMMEVRLSKNKK